uniref:Ig-like domain-containing protein n=1 Tax=Oryzias melastigma TaxID=30732 RepID=A0A3B3BYV5_ORYME
MVNEFGYCSLDYEVAYARDSGVITCRASNKFGVDQTSATLIVKDEKGLVEETQLPEGRKGAYRVDDIERHIHERGPAGVSGDEESEKTKPEIVLLPEPARVLEGDIARFRCRVTGYPAPKVNWYLNGQLIRKSKRYRLHYDGIYYLEIVDIKSYDSGEVRVVADNPLGTSEHTVKLEIQQREDFRSVLRRAPEQRPAEVPHESGRTGFDIVKVDRPGEVPQDRELIKHMDNIEVPETYAGEFEVEVSREDAEGIWYFGDKELSPSSKYIMSSRRGRHTLSVKDVRKEDQGKYTFVCGDLRTSASLKTKCILCVFAAVKIKKTLRNQTVTETQEAVFSLELTHPDVKGSQWIKNGVELQNSDKFEITSEGTVQTLKVKNCNTTDETVYSFKLGKLSANARLNVESKLNLMQNLCCAAIKIVKKIKDVTSLVDGTASFEMSLSHDNVPVKWMFKGQELKSSDKCKILSERKAHKLILQNVDSSSAGEYTAVAGHLQCSAVLTVEGTQQT